MSSLAERFKRIAFWGYRCKCGCFYEQHSFNDWDACPYFPGAPKTRFTLEDRLTLIQALSDAYGRRCSFEIPERCYGSVNATLCGRQIPASSDPCVDFCFKHLTEGVGL